jgi:multiple sugar transport system substrate-binding protein
MIATGGGALVACTPTPSPPAAATSAPSTGGTPSGATATSAPAAGAAAGATNVAPATTSGQRISALMATDKPWLQETADRFRQDTGITVDLTLVDWNDISTKFIASAAGSSGGYDVVESDGNKIAWAEAGYIDDITDRIKDRNDLVRPDLFTANGKTYGMPWFVDALFFFWNKEYLSKAGITSPPRTWDDFVAAAQAVQSKAGVKYPITFQWKQIEGEFDLWLTFLFGFGGQLFDSDLKSPRFNDQPGVDALQFMSDLNQKHKVVDPNSFASRPLEVTQNLAAGNTAFGILWGGLSGTLTDPKSSKVVGQIESSLIPVMGSNPSTTVDGSETVSLVAKSQNKDAAWQWIDYLTNKKTTTDVLLNYQTLPPWKSLYTDADLNKKVPWMKAFGSQLEHDYVRPTKPWYDEFSKTMQVATISVLTGQQSAKQALDDAAAKTTDLIQKS